MEIQELNQVVYWYLWMAKNSSEIFNFQTMIGQQAMPYCKFHFPNYMQVMTK